MRYACDYCRKPIRGDYLIMFQMDRTSKTYIETAVSESAFCGADCLISFINNKWSEKEAEK